MTTKVALALGVEGLKPFAQNAEHGQVHAAGRLVEQNEPRPGHERHGGVEQLLLAVAQGAGELAARCDSAKNPIIRSAASRKPGIARGRTGARYMSLDVPARPE